GWKAAAGPRPGGLLPSDGRRALCTRPSQPAANCICEGGESCHWSELGVVHRHGTKIFSCDLAWTGSATGRSVGDEFATGRARPWCIDRAVDQRAVGWTKRTALAAGDFLRVSVRGTGLCIDRQGSQRLVCVLLGCVRASGWSNGMGVLDNSAAIEY